MSEDYIMDENKNIPREKRDMVVSSKAKKKRFKIWDLFVAEDIENVKEYILRDVFIPSIKKLIHDSVTNSVDMILYHDTRGSSGKGGSSTISMPRYRKAFENEKNRSNNYSENRSRSQYADVIVDNRTDAEEILRTMDDLCSEYGFASVADLYDIAGLDTKPTDNNYGWLVSGVRDAKIIRNIDGYLLKFPRPAPLD